jgi:hypothetical protein
MRKYQLVDYLIIMLFGLCLVVSGCNKSTSPLPTQPVGEFSDIKNVTVSRPNEVDIDQLTSINKLPGEACTINDEAKVCSISTSQIIKWGWGICVNDEASLRAVIPNAQVELIVNGIRIPDYIIYQRDETNDRPKNPYCHTWSIKLENWQNGSTVRLENWAFTSQLGPQNNVFVLNVK